ncbi:unnamed protein product [Auanema sp. JU1783]|nr:unnamed protein product [Auanema sp. JU1783]
MLVSLPNDVMISEQYDLQHDYNDIVQPSTHSHNTTGEEIEIVLDSKIASYIRIIGNRSRGIFIDHIHRDIENDCRLQSGDQIKYCNDKNFAGLTTEQAASVLRYSLNNFCSLRLVIHRHEKAAELMVYRRSLVSVAQEQEEQWRIANSTHRQHPTASMTMSKSLPAFNSWSNCRKRVYHVAPSTTTALLKTFEMEEDSEPLTDPSTKSRKSFNLSKSIHAFDTSEIREKVTCPICNKETRLKFLHIWTHNWMNSARRLLPYSKSESALNTTQYTLL